MKLARSAEFPDDRLPLLRRAVVLQWIIIVFILSTVVLLYLVMGNSQAMKTAWVEDVLALFPPIIFLIVNRIRQWAPTERYPYGYHRAVGIGFLGEALLLLGFGLMMLGQGAMQLIRAEHPTIGTIELGPWRFWQGWAMLPVLVYAAVGPVILGRLLMRPADALHDKVLFAGAAMLKADWLSALAAAIGVLGLAIGLWWLDAVAAMVISLDIIRDGAGHVRAVLGDLMDREPEEATRPELDPLPRRLRQMLDDLPWVARSEVRLREHGHVFFGEAFVVPHPGHEPSLTQLIAGARQAGLALDWRLQDLTIQPMPGSEPEGAERSGSSEGQRDNNQ